MSATQRNRKAQPLSRKTVPGLPEVVSVLHIGQKGRRDDYKVNFGNGRLWDLPSYCLPTVDYSCSRRGDAKAVTMLTKMVIRTL